MAIEQFAYAAGLDNEGSLVNVETIVPTPPHILEVGPVSAVGEVARVTLSRRTLRNGSIRHRWTFSVLRDTDYTALIEDMFGDMTTSYAELTIQTMKEGGGYGVFNAVAARPIPSDYRVINYSYRDVPINFEILNEIEVA